MLVWSRMDNDEDSQDVIRHIYFSPEHAKRTRNEYERTQYVQSLVLHTSDYETAFGSRSMAEAPSGGGTGPFTTRNPYFSYTGTPASLASI